MRRVFVERQLSVGGSGGWSQERDPAFEEIYRNITLEDRQLGISDCCRRFLLISHLTHMNE